ncbi:MAG: septum formation initiator family protein [Bacteroidales bacterium]|nr:septum formation initiator family protein [Bacteroidales bacterium]MBQ7489092.1 septum formation initiator family protein [Bacteroidales bacterium]
MGKNEPVKWNKWVYIGLYGGTALLFFLYIFFISDNNLKKHIQLNRKIKSLEESILQTKNRINNKYTYEELKNNDKLLEKYAREQLNMQKEGEDVFVIVYE